MANKPANITLQHALAYLYIYFAKKSDNNLSNDEIIFILKKIRAWSINEEQSANSNNVVTESANWYDSLTSDEQTEEVSKLIVLLAQLQSESKLMILEDLKQLAGADGVVNQGEIDFFKAIAKAMGFELNA